MSYRDRSYRDRITRSPSPRDRRQRWDSRDRDDRRGDPGPESSGYYRNRETYRPRRSRSPEPYRRSSYSPDLYRRSYSPVPWLQRRRERSPPPSPRRAARREPDVCVQVRGIPADIPNSYLAQAFNSFGTIKKHERERARQIFRVTYTSPDSVSDLFAKARRDGFWYLRDWETTALPEGVGWSTKTSIRSESDVHPLTNAMHSPWLGSSSPSVDGDGNRYERGKKEDTPVSPVYVPRAREPIRVLPSEPLRDLSRDPRLRPNLPEKPSQMVPPTKPASRTVRVDPSTILPPKPQLKQSSAPSTPTKPQNVTWGACYLDWAGINPLNPVFNDFSFKSSLSSYISRTFSSSDTAIRKIVIASGYGKSLVYFSSPDAAALAATRCTVQPTGFYHLTDEIAVRLLRAGDEPAHSLPTGPGVATGPKADAAGPGMVMAPETTANATAAKEAATVKSSSGTFQAAQPKSAPQSSISASHVEQPAKAPPSPSPLKTKAVSTNQLAADAAETAGESIPPSATIELVQARGQNPQSDRSDSVVEMEPAPSPIIVKRERFEPALAPLPAPVLAPLPAETSAAPAAPASPPPPPALLKSSSRSTRPPPISIALTPAPSAVSGTPSVISPTVSVPSGRVSRVETAAKVSQSTPEAGPSRTGSAAPLCEAAPFKDCYITLSGIKPGEQQNSAVQIIADLGGVFSKSLTRKCSHLVSAFTASDPNASVKVKWALNENETRRSKGPNEAEIAIVYEEWLRDSAKHHRRMLEADYDIRGERPQRRATSQVAAVSATAEMPAPAAEPPGAMTFTEGPSATQSPEEDLVTEEPITKRSLRARRSKAVTNPSTSPTAVQRVTSIAPSTSKRARPAPIPPPTNATPPPETNKRGRARPRKSVPAGLATSEVAPAQADQNGASSPFHRVKMPATGAAADGHQPALNTGNEEGDCIVVVASDAPAPATMPPPPPPDLKALPAPNGATLPPTNSTSAGVVEGTKVMMAQSSSPRPFSPSSRSVKRPRTISEDSDMAVPDNLSDERTYAELTSELMAERIRVQNLQQRLADIELVGSVRDIVYAPLVRAHAGRLDLDGRQAYVAKLKELLKTSALDLLGGVETGK